MNDSDYEHEKPGKHQPQPSPPIAGGEESLVCCALYNLGRAQQCSGNRSGRAVDFLEQDENCPRRAGFAAHRSAIEDGASH